MKWCSLKATSLDWKSLNLDMKTILKHQKESISTEPAEAILEEEKARKSAPEVQCRKFKICDQCREVCARRRKTSTTEWLGARSLRTILDRWGPPHIEPEAEPPELLYWDDGGDHGFICAGQYSAGFSPR